MTTHSHSFDTHMNFRMTSHDKKVIETAARLKGLKPNTYARQRLLEIAEKDIAELNRLNNLVLNESDWELFIGIMKAPIAVNDNLKKAVSQFNKKMQAD